MADNVRMFGLDGKPPAFDRVYNQADGIWMNYPQAEIKERFAPVTLRDDRIVRRIWEAEGKKVVRASGDLQAAVAGTGEPLFTKPVTISFRSGKAELAGEAMAALNQQVVPQVQMAAGMYIRVEGNTDNLGDESWNLDLSERRAQAIVDYLVSRGIERGASSPRATDRPSRSPATRPPRAGPATAAPTSSSSPRSRRRQG